MLFLLIDSRGKLEYNIKRLVYKEIFTSDKRKENRKDDKKVPQ